MKNEARSAIMPYVMLLEDIKSMTNRVKVVNVKNQLHIEMGLIAYKQTFGLMCKRPQITQRAGGCYDIIFVCDRTMPTSTQLLIIMLNRIFGREL